MRDIVRLLDAALDRIAGHTQGRLLIAARLDPDRGPIDVLTLAGNAEILGYVTDDD